MQIQFVDRCICLDIGMHKYLRVSSRILWDIAVPILWPSSDDALSKHKVVHLLAEGLAEDAEALALSAC
jgi:hypothetical protein